MMPIVSLCEKGQKRKFKNEVLRYATKIDGDGFPLEGVLPLGFECPLDLSKVADAERLQKVKDVMRITRENTGEGDKEKQVTIHSLQVCAAYAELKVGTLVAIKEGCAIVAFAEITSGYVYEKEQVWGKHRWGFRVIRKATPQEGILRNGLYRTFYSKESKCAIPIPTDIMKEKTKDVLQCMKPVLESAERAVAAAGEQKTKALLAFEKAQKDLEDAELNYEKAERELATVQRMQELAPCFTS